MRVIIFCNYFGENIVLLDDAHESEHGISSPGNKVVVLHETMH